MSKEDDSKKPKKEGEEKESDLEEILEESKEDSEKKESDEDEKEKTKQKPINIIPEFHESRTRSFLNFLNRDSSITLDRRNPFEAFPSDLELSVENSPASTQQKPEEEKNEKSEFEYIAKPSEKKQQGVYQHYENISGIKMQKAEKAAERWSNPLAQKTHFQNISSENIPKQDTRYEIYVKPQKIEDIEKAKKEKEFDFQESKMEYYSHK